LVFAGKVFEKLQGMRIGLVWIGLKGVYIEGRKVNFLKPRRLSTLVLRWKQEASYKLPHQLFFIVKKWVPSILCAREHLSNLVP